MQRARRPELPARQVLRRGLREIRSYCTWLRTAAFCLGSIACPPQLRPLPKGVLSVLGHVLRLRDPVQSGNPIDMGDKSFSNRRAMA